MDGMVKGDGLLGDGGEGWLDSGSRRRRWSAARKAVIVAESLVAGAKVSEVAARHGVNADMLSAWRSQVSAGGMSRPKSAPISSAVTFAQVKVVAAGPQSDARADLRPAAGAIEIMLGDASIRVVKGFDTATLSRVLAAGRGGRGGSRRGRGCGYGWRRNRSIFAAACMGLSRWSRKHSALIHTGARYLYS